MIMSKERAQLQACRDEVAALMLAELQRRGLPPEQVQAQYTEALAMHPLTRQLVELAQHDGVLAMTVPVEQ